jgi:hypothetical protein
MILIEQGDATLNELPLATKIIPDLATHTPDKEKPAEILTLL